MNTGLYPWYAAKSSVASRVNIRDTLYSWPVLSYMCCDSILEDWVGCDALWVKRRIATYGKNIENHVFVYLRTKSAFSSTYDRGREVHTYMIGVNIPTYYQRGYHHGGHRRCLQKKITKPAATLASAHPDHENVRFQRQVSPTIITYMALQA